ncbi:branched-chain amino acid ABC transporter permease [Roseomonas sp. CCTCC AB2023176]|uniref:branched-chain amino acid ABC transporter permease n=1 Tax=Roseomonas sp. CCTCC AB2023176 TaxID=3342640 RepID=UPI0035D8ADB8
MVVASRTGHLVMALCAALLACLPFAVGYYEFSFGAAEISTYHLQLASKALVWAMFALSYQLLVGGVGLVSLGHAAFFGVGAYTVYLMPVGMSVLLTLPVAAILAAVAAVPIGAMSLRTRGFFFLMVTLAFGQMVYFLFHDTPLGGGKDGVFITRPALEIFGAAIEVRRRDWPRVMLWLNLGLLATIYAALVAFMRTSLGAALQGIRANEERMRALGYDTARLKFVAFVLACALAGVSGHMWAMNEAFVNPELLSWHLTAQALLMLILGGIGALHGPILGALAYVGLEEVATMVTERQRLVQGLVMLAVVLLLPKGLASLRFRLARRRPAPVVREAAP